MRTCTPGVVLREYEDTVKVCLSSSSYGSKLSFIFPDPSRLTLNPPPFDDMHPFRMQLPATVAPAAKIPVALMKSLLFIRSRIFSL